MPQNAAPQPLALADVKQQGEGNAPYINSWLLLGTFDNDKQNSGYDRDFIGETSAAPQEGQTAATQKWRFFDDRLFSRNYDDYNDLYSYFSIRQNLDSAAKVAYLHSYVYSPTDQNVQLRVGADTSYKAWINGTLAAASTRSTPVAGKPAANVAEQAANTESDRDYVTTSVALQSGWNRLLLKIANTEEGRFGCYARLTTASGAAPSGLIYSTGGGAGKLAIENRAMPEAKTGDLPTAWREWPYVGARPDLKTFAKETAMSGDANGQKPPLIGGMLGRQYFNPSKALQSSDFRFTARGGQAPYSWTKVSGTLPTGLTLAADGTLSGKPATLARLRDYKFVVQVRDASGQTARREYSLTLQERPNRAVERKRLLGLIHATHTIVPSYIPEMARMMKREGYGFGVPISFNNGDHSFRWDTRFGKNLASGDRIALYKKAFEDAGVGFGMYLGNMNVPGSTPFTINQQVMVMKEVLERYHPKIIWFDWLGMEGTSLDSLYSVIRSFDPNIVVILNGSERLSNGDWDIVTFEGLNALDKAVWSAWPSHFTWPKKFSPESWRVMHDPAWGYVGNYTSTWPDVLRVQIALIGEGFIADMDHSASLGAIPSEKLLDYPLMRNHAAMADWASPAGKPSLYEAYTNVDTGPLQAGTYGYNTMNVPRDAVYLLAQKNPRGKVGLPANGKLNVGALAAKVKSVTWMNANKSLPFSQSASTRALTIDTQNVPQDEIATIIKIALEKPLPEGSSLPVAPPSLSSAPTPPGNLATGKPAWLMSADDSHELGPSTTSYAIYGVDGNPDTVAVAGGEWAWSYKVDLKKSHSVRRIVVHFAEKLWATQYVILLSQDGANWTTVASDAAGTPGRHEFVIAPVQARFVRVQALKPNDANQVGGQMAIAELEVYE